MNNFTKILLMVWAVLAVLSFVCAFFLPILPKIVGIVFGVLNIAIILNWFISAVSAYRQTKALNNSETKADE